jgi:curli production assembly/transport component CsgG
MMRRAIIAAIAATALPLGACAHMPAVETSHLPTLTPASETHDALVALSPPTEPVTVSIYGFVDQTGQFKPSETGQTLSRAVSQGGGAVLMKALGDAGAGRWFTVLEREQLRNLLTERQLITEMRQRYSGEAEVNAQVLPSLLYSGLILEGGIISYDSNTLTGGAGANLLGIGGDAQYRQDTVSVYLRAVSVKTGQVLLSVQTSKTLASFGIRGGAFRYVGLKELLQAEAGYTTNEPGQVALQAAVEKAVHALVMEGAERRLWSFADETAAWPARWRYAQERDGRLSPEQVAHAERTERRTATLAVRP